MIDSKEIDEVETELSEPTEGSELVTYGVVLMASSIVLGLLFGSRIFGHPVAYAAMPVLCLALIFFRTRVFESVVSLLVLFGVGVVGVLSGPSVLSVYGRLTAAAAITTIVAAVRFQTLAKPNTQLIASSRLNYTPTSNVQFVPYRFGVGHSCSIPMIIGAWIGGGFLCRDLAAFSSNQAYSAIYNKLQAGIGLLPEWNAGVTILLSLAFMIWFTNKVFEYFHFRNADKSVAAMHLRSELWKWNGWDQRTISKQMQKNEGK